MSTPAQVTEAHRKLAQSIKLRWCSYDDAAQLIADSEARVVAAAVVTLEARITSDEELFHDIRMKLTAACGDPYKLHDEALDAIITERDRLRADVERLTAELEQESKWKAREYLARAERAEAELDGIRALADRRNERDHSQDTTHQLVAALDQGIDIAQAELATERARLDYLSTLGFEHRHHETGDHLGHEWTISSYGESEDVTLRDVIDAEMREGAK